jgi:hypothetical protein
MVKCVSFKTVHFQFYGAAALQSSLWPNPPFVSSGILHYSTESACSGCKISDEWRYRLFRKRRTPSDQKSEKELLARTTGCSKSCKVAGAESRFGAVAEAAVPQA